MPSLMRIGAKHPSSQRDHCMFSKVGQIHYFRVVTPLWTTRESQHRSSELGRVPITGFMLVLVCDSISRKGDCHAPS